MIALIALVLLPHLLAGLFIWFAESNDPLPEDQLWVLITVLIICFLAGVSSILILYKGGFAI